MALVLWRLDPLFDGRELSENRENAPNHKVETAEPQLDFFEHFGEHPHRVI
ncbi:MAG: hypothetical protein HY897_12025 [Deltaproteobacteria bacterium]|nr:hypothetical protein [Deltaproteobacteria bacterium]